MEAVDGMGLEELAHDGVACPAGTSGRGMRFELRLIINYLCLVFAVGSPGFWWRTNLSG
jgi:hypothetical protein